MPPRRPPVSDFGKELDALAVEKVPQRGDDPRQALKPSDDLTAG